MSTLTASSSFCKRNVSALVGAILLGATHAATGATFTNNNGAGGSLWNLPANWNTGTLPIATTLAYIPTGVTGASGSLFITTGSSGSLGTSANAGTLVIDAPTGQYASLVASDAFYTQTGSPRDATITFGTSEADGGLDYDPSGDATAQVFHLGMNSGSNGTLTVNVPRRLVMRGGGDGAEGVGAVSIGSPIQGAGLVTFRKLPGISDIDAGFEEASQDGSMRYSTFTGGTEIDAETYLILRNGSNHDGSGTFQSGPIGLGTCNLNGGTLWLTYGDNNATRLANDVRLTAGSAIRVAPKPAALTGEMEMGGYRLSVSAYARLEFDDANWSS